MADSDGVRGRWLLFGLLGWALVACRETQWIDLRSQDPWRSAVALFGRADEPVAVAADLDASDGVLEISSDHASTDELLVLFYRLPLDALLLPGGLLPRAPSLEGRHLPTPDAARRVRLGDAAPAEDISADVTGSEAFRSFLVPAPSPEACAGVSGCYPREVGECTIPCPVESVAREAALPEAPRFTCGDWPRVRVSALGIDDPRTAEIEVCNAGLRTTCPLDQAYVPGRGCVEVVSSCLEWPAGLGDGVVFVRPGAQGGDGSRARPLGSIADAVRGGTDAAPRILALGPGRLEESLELSTPVEVHGCGTTLAGRWAVGPGRSMLTNLRFAPGSQILVSPGREVALEGVAFESDVAPTPRLRVLGEASVSRARLELGEGQIAIEGGGRVTLERAEILASGEGALRVSEGGLLRVSDVTLAGAAISMDRGLVEVEGVAQLDGLLLEAGQNSMGALVKASGSSTITVARAVVRSEGSETDGIWTLDQARLEVRSSAFFGGRQALLAERDARVTADDLVVHGGQAAVASSGKARVGLHRVLAHGLMSNAFAVGGEASFSATDAMAMGVSSAAWVFERGHVDLERAYIADAWHHGIGLASRPATRSRLADITLENVGIIGLVAWDSAILGSGSLAFGSRLTANRVTLRKGYGIGIWMTQGADAVLEDIVVEDLLPASPEACRRASMPGQIVICSGEGIRLASYARGSLTSFRVRRAARGLIVGGYGFAISEGRIEDSERGLLFVDRDVALEPALDRVRLFNVAEPVTFGAEE